MSHHHKTVEAGGWLLLLAVIALILYLLFHKNGQAALQGAAGVKIGGVALNQPNAPPVDPSKQSMFIAGDGTLWQWDVSGQQWHIAQTGAIADEVS